MFQLQQQQQQQQQHSKTTDLIDFQQQIDEENASPNPRPILQLNSNTPIKRRPPVTPTKHQLWLSNQLPPSSNASASALLLQQQLLQQTPTRSSFGTSFDRNLSSPLTDFGFGLSNVSNNNSPRVRSSSSLMEMFMHSATKKGPSLLLHTDSSRPVSRCSSDAIFGDNNETFGILDFNNTTSKTTFDWHTSNVNFLMPPPSTNMIQSLDMNYFSTQFRVLSVLGSGEFAQVYLALSSSDKSRYAVKKTTRPFIGHRDRLLKIQEFTIMHLLTTSEDPCSIHVVKLFSAWEQHGFLYLQMQLCDHGTLGHYFSHMDTLIIDMVFLRQTIRGIAEGLNFIHSMGVIHLDIKPSNILLHGSNRTVKIGDFGTALIMHSNTNSQEHISIDTVDTTMHSTEVESDGHEGDRTYMAREILDGIYTPAADVCSFGLVLLQWLKGGSSLPDSGDGWQQLRRDDFSMFPVLACMEGSEFVQVCGDMLREQWEARITLSELLQLLD